MKDKEIQQIKIKPIETLSKELVDYREKLRKFKFDLSQGKVKNIKEIKKTKKAVARILTVMNKINLNK
ncbi:50S ribosomal protein L29 [Candidatus Wolfebacteria bacterium]|uniref:Large ribosomal subunit protein uL29 n=1 Tax=Candidatus Wolfebacteria bacterium CG_4_10_14_0_2_um_filter_39_18 TaxID=1975061 RepID=A0A2M7THU7_9BACT|nr:50S ribosomal protein L29 [Candidatus Wolfebacteria bacterium]NCO44535.1 50S ribosomal protein L29 [Candidatus Wolfebacteria bacterium]PIZ45436.1 MAG: 50S ribosomal protein L29 [Candidatus Wolfebacteria bacterium CG_4_10_14_0_2_um_filter_39_18]